MKIKKIISILAILFLFTQFFVNLSSAQTTTNTVTTTQTPAASPLGSWGTLKDLYNFFSSINPFVLLIFGIILLVVSHLGKYVAAALIIFAVIQILLLLVR